MNVVLRRGRTTITVPMNDKLANGQNKYKFLMSKGFRPISQNLPDVIEALKAEGVNDPALNLREVIKTRVKEKALSKTNKTTSYKTVKLANAYLDSISKDLIEMAIEGEERKGVLKHYESLAKSNNEEKTEKENIEVKDNSDGDVKLAHELE